MKKNDTLERLCAGPWQPVFDNLNRIGGLEFPDQNPETFQHYEQVGEMARQAGLRVSTAIREGHSIIRL